MNTMQTQSNHSRRVRLRIRRLRVQRGACVLCVLQVFVLVTTVQHFAMVSHGVGAGGDAEHAHALHSEHLSEQRNEAAVSASDADHSVVGSQSCELWQLVAESAVLPAPKSTEALVPPQLPDLLAQMPARAPPAALPVLSLAPKQSPPIQPV